LANAINFLAAFLRDSSGIGRLVLKGCEASGFVSAETTLALYAAVKEMRQTAANSLDILIWGGVATPEAAAAFLATGAAGIVFESVHWLTDLVAIDDEQRHRLLNLRLDSTDLVGLALQVPCRLFTKGNSLAFKEIKAVGAKKALDYLDKASRSPAEFQRAIQHQDTRILTGMFGFSKKTAEKLIAGFSGKLGTPPPPPSGGDLASELDRAGPLAQAAEALAALGYKPAEYRAAIESIHRDLQDRELPDVSEILRMALRRL